LRLWLAFGRQLRCPSGVFGRVVGWFMILLNHKPNHLAIEALAPASTDRVLEVGFGPGRGLRMLVDRVNQGKVVGIDRSEEMLHLAGCANRSAVTSGRLSLMRRTEAHLPFADGAFDKVLLVNVVYFFDRAGRDMAEVHRVLRPGGAVAIYATEGHPQDSWAFTRGDEPHRTFVAEELLAFLMEAGFEEEAVEIRRVDLPLGLHGLVAVARRTAPLAVEQRLAAE
jgi:SAM-dependent methyltransferase